MKDAVSGNTAPHYFGIPDVIKHVSAKQMLKVMYSTELSEARLELANFEEFSYEDNKFL